jgi:hypothetical protein
MAQRRWRAPLRRDRGNGLPLVRMRYAVLGTWSLGAFKHLHACGPDRQHSLALPHLNLLACQLQRTWQSIEHPIVGDVAIPGHFALLGGEAFPGNGFGQRQEFLLGQTIYWASVPGAMNARIDAFAPGMRLAIELIQVAESDPRP